MPTERRLRASEVAIHPATPQSKPCTGGHHFGWLGWRALRRRRLATRYDKFAAINYLAFDQLASIRL